MSRSLFNVKSDSKLSPISPTINNIPKDNFKNKHFLDEKEYSHLHNICLNSREIRANGILETQIKKRKLENKALHEEVNKNKNYHNAKKHVLFK